MGWSVHGQAIAGNAKDFAGGKPLFDTLRVVTPGAWLKGDD